MTWEYPWVGREKVLAEGRTRNLPAHRHRCEVQLADGSWAPAIYNRDGFGDGGDTHTFWNPDGWVMYEDGDVVAFRQLLPKPGRPGVMLEPLGRTLEKLLQRVGIKEVMRSEQQRPHGRRPVAERTNRRRTPGVTAEVAEPSDPTAGLRAVSVAITGGRGHRPPLSTLEDAERILRDGGFTTIHHGACRGVDLEVSGFLNQRGFETVAHPPDLDAHGSPAAYHIRNAELVEASSLLLAWPGGRGTLSAITKATKAGVPVRQMTTDGVVVALVPVANAGARLAAGERFCSICGAFVGRFVRHLFTRAAACGVGKGCYRCRDHTQEDLQ